MGSVADMHRFLISPDSISDGFAAITGEDAKHMLQVLRLKEGDTFLAFDGTGLEYELELASVERGKVSGRVKRAYEPGTEPETKVVLFQGIPKTDKMDWIIQKTVELGVWQIVPLLTQYSVPQVKGKNLDGRLERWNRVSREACKQSGRVIVPEVKEPVPFNKALELWNALSSTDSGAACMPVFCYEKEGKKCLKDLLKCYTIDHVNVVGVFIGPEGGFSDLEHQLALKCRFMPVSLGKRILRTETAAMAVLSVIMQEMGEWRV